MRKGLTASPAHGISRPRSANSRYQGDSLATCLTFWLNFPGGSWVSVVERCESSMESSASNRSSLLLPAAPIWQGPIAPREISRFPPPTILADFRPRPCEKLCRSFRRCIRGCAPLDLPGSRQVFRFLPPPLTPEGQTSASARSFLVGDGLQQIRKTGLH